MTIDRKTFRSEKERQLEPAALELLHNTPIPPEHLIDNLGLFLNSRTMGRILFFHHLYQLALSVQGVAVEFGVRWGQTLSLLHAFRSIYEPYNSHSRVILGFDTFTGFPAIEPQDGQSDFMQTGHTTTTEHYEDYLTNLLRLKEQENPLNHLEKFVLIKGDVKDMLPLYLQQHPETIFALLCFDLDLYGPTKECLRLVKPRLTRGSVLAFDELNDEDSPGETLAVMEELGLNNVALKRLPFVSRMSYLVIE